jgi:rhodanese-related sulfurtransferase
MVVTAKQLLEEANAVVPKLTPKEAREMMAKGNVLASGKVEGAVHAPRGLLEFRADPASPYYDKNFDKNKTVILYCASGGRSALSGKTLKDMGYDKVYNLGQFKEWVDSGGKVDKPS